MRTFTTAARILLGAGFLLFGLNFFVPFLPMPAPPPEVLPVFGALMAVKYLTIVKTFEVACGLLLLSNRFVPLALTLLAPLLVAITTFHAVLEPSGLPLPLALIALELVLAWQYRAAFAPMLRARTRPATLGERGVGHELVLDEPVVHAA